MLYDAYTYEIEGSGSLHPDMPAYLGDQRVTVFDPARRPQDTTPELNLSFHLAQGAVAATFTVSRFGSESAAVLVDLDGEPVIELLGPGESMGVVHEVQLGALPAGHHTITLEYLGGGANNGFYIDALSLHDQDCVGGERCDGLDNNDDGSIDESFGDSDHDGIADCVDTETCDGLDNDGDGDIDEDQSDSDGDGLCDQLDTETCDGIDNNGDGVTDEGFADSDHDGIADCVDTETCDDVDNDGDGEVDEGFYDAVTYTWTSFDPGGGGTGGELEETTFTYDVTTGSLTFFGQVYCPPDVRTDTLTLAVNDGPNPKGQGDLALFYLDAVDVDAPILSVYAYNGENTSTSWHDGSSSSGTQDPDQLFTSLAGSQDWLQALDVWTDNSRIYWTFTVDAAMIQDHRAVHPGTSWDWFGAGFGPEIGVWYHVRAWTETSYDDHGWLTQYESDLQTWLDTSHEQAEPSVEECVAE
jgi:hypothetical protein